MHVFKTVVMLTAAISVSGIGEWRVARLAGDELIRHSVKAGLA